MPTWSVYAARLLLVRLPSVDHSIMMMMIVVYEALSYDSITEPPWTAVSVLSLSPAQGRDREALLCLEAEAAAIAKQVRISLDFPVFLSFFEKHKQDTMEPAKDDFSPKCTNAGHRWTGASARSKGIQKAQRVGDCQSFSCPAFNSTRETWTMHLRLGQLYAELDQDIEVWALER